MKNTNTYSIAKAITAFIVCFILALLLLGLFTSCNVINKHRSVDKLKLDSVSVSKSDSNTITQSDSSVNIDTHKATDKTIVDSDSNTININFDSGYIDTDKPITIEKDGGKTTINVGGRKIKSLTETTKKTSQKNDTKTIDSSISTKQSIIKQQSKSTSDSTSVQKQEKKVDFTKEKSGLSWIVKLLLWVVLILILLWFIGRILYRKGLLPLSLPIAIFLCYAKVKS